MIEPRVPSDTDEMEESIRQIVTEALEHYLASGADVNKSEISPVSGMTLTYKIARESMLTRGANDETSHRVGLLVSALVFKRAIDRSGYVP